MEDFRHIQADCPTKMRSPSLKEQTMNKMVMKSKYAHKLEEVDEYGDEGEYLMVRHVLHLDSTKGGNHGCRTISPIHIKEEFVCSLLILEVVQCSF